MSTDPSSATPSGPHPPSPALNNGRGEEEVGNATIPPPVIGGTFLDQGGFRPESQEGGHKSVPQGLSSGVARHFNAGSGALCLLILTILLVRVVALNTDAPSFLSWSPGIYSDEGYYTGDARSEVLFGHPALGDFHSALVCPLAHQAQLAVFSLFGAGLVQARSISVAASLAALFVWYLALRRLYGAPTALLGTAFLGLSAPFVLYNRLALIETPATLCLILAFWLAALPKKAAWVGIALGLAGVVKPIWLLAAPAFVLEKARSPRETLLLLLGVLLPLALYAAFCYLPHRGVLSHMGAYYLNGQYLPPGRASLLVNLSRRLFSGAGDDVLPYLARYATVLLILGAFGVGIACRQRQPGDLLLVAWLAVPVVAFLSVAYTPSRYYVLFWPALAALAARGSVVLSTSRLIRSAGVRSALIGIIIAAFLLSNGFLLARAWAGRHHDLVNGSLMLSRTLPQGSILAGQMAPALCLDNRFQALMVQPGLANDTHPVERYGVTYILITRSAYWDTWWKTRYPPIIKRDHLVATLKLSRYTVDVYRAKTVNR